MLVVVVGLVSRYDSVLNSDIFLTWIYSFKIFHFKVRFQIWLVGFDNQFTFDQLDAWDINICSEKYL